MRLKDIDEKINYEVLGTLVYLLEKTALELKRFIILGKRGSEYFYRCI